MKNNQYTATPDWFDKVQQTTPESTNNVYIGRSINTIQQAGLTDILIEITGEEEGNGLAPEVTWNKEESKLSFVKTKFLKEGDPIINADYVTTIKDNPQEVLSNKDFIDGLSINKHRFFEKDGILYLDGNLALTGGLVVYADNPEDGGGPGPEFGGGGTILDIEVKGEGNALADVTLSEDKTILTFTKFNAVDVTSNQDITGIKNFLNGIKLNGHKLYEKDGVIYLEGDLAVTGGITTFATAGREVSTIMDGIACDETTIRVNPDTKKLEVIGGVGDLDSDKLWELLENSTNEQINKSHLTTALQGYATETWATNNLLGKNSNAISASKLQTARTIWGQSFDGTNNVSGDMTNVGSITASDVIKAASLSGTNIRIECDDNGYLGKYASEINNFRSNLYLQQHTTGNVILCNGGGKVGVKTITPSTDFEVNGIAKVQAIYFERKNEINTYGEALHLNYRGGIEGTNGYTGNVTICANGGNVGIGTPSPSTRLYVNGTARVTNTLTIDRAGIDMSYGNNWKFIRVNWDGIKGDYIQFFVPGNNAQDAYFEMRSNGTFHVNYNILANGGITQYSDSRAKNIIEDVNIDLDKIANSPAIRFKWNGYKDRKDDGKTHIGGIAQYVQRILPEVIYNTDGAFTMDYAITGYIFAVNTAKHLLSYETKTDKEINKLKKRIKYLEKQLKKLGYEEANIMDNQNF